MVGSAVRDVVLDGDAYTGDWENSDCAEDGDVVDADVGDEAPELVWSQECQDDQLLTRPGCYFLASIEACVDFVCLI